MSISATPPAKKSKKNKLVSLPSTPALLLGQPTEPILVQEEEDAEEVEEDEEAEENEDEDEEEDAQLPPPPARFTSVWKAVAASGKEALPGTKSAIYNVNNLFLFQLEAWRDQILVDLLL